MGILNIGLKNQGGTGCPLKYAMNEGQYFLKKEQRQYRSITAMAGRVSSRKFARSQEWLEVTPLGSKDYFSSNFVDEGI